jgi:N-acetylneuraminic acid mutarotase
LFRAIVFGGFNPSPDPKSLNTIQIYECETNRWQVLPLNGATPRGRAYHSATIIGQNMWIFSGMDGTKKF